MQKHNTYIGWIAGLSAASIWGGMYVVSKVVLEVIPPFSLLALRLILGAISLGVVITFRNQKHNLLEHVEKNFFWPSFWVGIVGYGVSLAFQFIGTKLSTASNGALVTSATPAFVLVFAPFILKEKVTAMRVFALVISTIGVIAVIDPRTADFSSMLFWGNMSLIAAALTWALYSVLVRKVTSSTDLLVSSTVMLIGGIPSSLAFSVWEIKTNGLGEITSGIIGGILFVGIISTAIAMFLWNYALTQLPAANASLTFFAQPLVGTLLGWFFLDETITPLFILGGILIGIGILISAKE